MCIYHVMSTFDIGIDDYRVLSLPYMVQSQVTHVLKINQA